MKNISIFSGLSCTIYCIWCCVCNHCTVYGVLHLYFRRDWFYKKNSVAKLKWILTALLFFKNLCCFYYIHSWWGHHEDLCLSLFIALYHVSPYIRHATKANNAISPTTQQILVMIIFFVSFIIPRPPSVFSVAEADD